MKCEKAMDAFCAAGREDRVTFLAARHIASCGSCSREAEIIGRAESLLSECVPAASRDISASIMGAVRLLPRPEPAPAGFRQWLGAGLAILATFVLLPFGDDFLWGKATFGAQYLLPLYLVLGCVLVIYILLFVLSHVEALTQLFRLGKPRN